MRLCIIGRSNRIAFLLLIISLPVAGAAAVPALELALLPARGDAGALAAAEDAAAAADTAGWWAGEAGAAEAVAVAGLPPRRKTLTTPWVCSQICRKRRTWPARIGWVKIRKYSPCGHLVRSQKRLFKP